MKENLKVSGEKSSVVESKVQEVNNINEAQLAKVGLAHYIYNVEVEDILSMDIKTLSDLTPDSIGEKAYVLAQYALYLQKEYNRLRSLVLYCQHSIDQLLSKEYANFDHIFGNDLKKEAFINSNDWARALNEKRKELSVQTDSLFGISQSVKFMSETLIELQRSKRKSH